MGFGAATMAVADLARHTLEIDLMERWLSGRKRQFAKLLYGLNRTGGSNPPLSANFTSNELRSLDRKVATSNRNTHPRQPCSLVFTPVRTLEFCSSPPQVLVARSCFGTFFRQASTNSRFQSPLESSGQSLGSNSKTGCRRKNSSVRILSPTRFDCTSSPRPPSIPMLFKPHVVQCFRDFSLASPEG